MRLPGAHIIFEKMLPM